MFKRFSTKSQDLKQLFTARLSRRVVLWIFGSFALIVTIILVPSLQHREQEMLNQLRQVTSGKVLWIATTFPNTTPQQLLEKIQQLKKDPMLSSILGGAVYTEDGELIGTFGETPELPFSEAIAEGMMNFEASDRFTSHNSRYDATWIVSRPGPDDIVVIRHDASSVDAEVHSYIFQMTGLSLMISAVITATTMVVLGATAITPILTLRRDLLTAGDAIRHDQPTPQFQSNFIHRRDELGEVIGAFRQMFRQISQAVEERKQAEAELLDNNQQMSQYIQQVDRVTAAAAAVEAGTFQMGSLQKVSDRPDELGRLARMFQSMVEQVQEREAKLKQQVADLRIEIDQVKRAKQVSEVTQSDWFQALQSEVHSLRQKEAMQDEMW